MQHLHLPAHLSTDVPECSHGVLWVPVLYVLWTVEKKENIGRHDGQLGGGLVLDKTHQTCHEYQALREVVLLWGCGACGGVRVYMHVQSVCVWI